MGAGTDTFAIGDDAGNACIATVTDFEAGVDRVEVNYKWDPAVPADAPEITVVPHADNTGASIMLNGTKIADITGGQTLTTGDITVINKTTVAV